MSELLLQSEVLEQLRQSFSLIEQSLTTTIHEAAELTSLSESQLRYAESKGMLEPNRAKIPETTRGKGQRRYTADNLIRARLIAFLISKDYSFSEIDTFMTSNPDLIHDVLQTSAIRLKTATSAIDAIQYSRFVVPRMLYYALSLIFERDAVANAGIIIPLHAVSAAPTSGLTHQSTSDAGKASGQQDISAEDIGALGPILLAWRPESGPMITVLTAGNPFERDQRVILRPLEKLIQTVHERERESLCASFTEAQDIFIAYEPQVERELDEATRALNLRQSRGQVYADPRVVAARLIKQATRVFAERMTRTGDTELELARTQLYAAPELINPGMGDALLNSLAETLVALGGWSEKEPQQNRWRFACVLTPRDPYTPLKYQELVMRGQSSLSPHRINVTTTAYEKNGGLTFRAFSSGRIIYRPEVTPLDPAISYHDIEEPIKSAVAAPTVEGIGGGHGQPPAVMYITSEEPDAFTPNDFLLIRAMGRLVGEIVVTYNSRGHRPSALTDALVKPEIVDPFFAEFPSDSDFTKALSTYFKAANNALDGRHAEARRADEVEVSPEDEEKEPKAPQSLIIVAYDINDFTMIQAQRGNQVARILTREVGRRAKLRMESGFSRIGVQATLYLSYADRFIMVIRDERLERLDAARAFAERVRADLDGDYFLEGDQSISVRSRPTPDGLAGIVMSVRMAGVTFTRGDLERRLRDARRDTAACVASVARLVDDGLRQASEAPGHALWWNPSKRLWTLPQDASALEL